MGRCDEDLTISKKIKLIKLSGFCEVFDFQNHFFMWKLNTELTIKN